MVRLIQHIIYGVAFVIMKVTSLLFCPFRIVGRSNIPTQGPYILACNHHSFADPVLVGLNIKRVIHYMAKDSLFKNPVVGFILRGCGAFSLKRGRIDSKALKEALSYLEEGAPLLIFPQGTRRKAAEERKVNPGLGFLAVKSGVPVVPVRLIGTDKVLPKGAKWFKKHPVTIIFGQPVRFQADDDYQQVSRQTIDRILALSPS